MKIGEFSKQANIPVKTVRYYAEIGLLNPKTIGGENNYRYYDTNQIVELNKILALKEAGFTLKEIIFINKQQLSKEKFIKLLCKNLPKQKPN